MKQVFTLSDKDFEAVIIKMHQQVKANVLKTNGMIESLSKEIGDIKKNQMEILELKNTITKT